MRHVELDLTDSALSYQPGDSLAISPRNDSQIVDSVLNAAHLDGNSVVQIDGSTISLGKALSERRELTVLSRPLLENVAAEHAAISELLEDRKRLHAYFSIATRLLIFSATIP